MGETLDEVIANVGEALREWIGDRLSAGQPAPMPRTADAIRADPNEVKALAEATLVTSVPLLLDEGRAVRVNLSLDAGALAMIDAAARERGVTRSAFLVSAARQKILAES